MTPASKPPRPRPLVSHRLTAALVGTAVVPLSVFGLLAYLTNAFDPTVGRLLLFALS
jgi:hypothetical protein